MGRARGSNAIMALDFETTYGTPPVSGAYRKMPFVSSNLGAERSLIESDLLGQGRAPADPTYDVVSNDGDITVPLDAAALGWWLRLLFGPPVTSADGGNYVHRFNAGAQTLPSASIEIGHPDRPSYSTHYGIRANTLQINMQRSGLTSATMGLIGKGETSSSLTSNAGTPTAYTAARNPRFAAASGSIDIDGVPVGEVATAQISFSNGLEKNEVISADGEIGDVDPGMPSASVSLTTTFADLALYNKAVSGAPVALRLGWISSTCRLDIVVPRLFLPRTKRPTTGPGKVMAEFRGIAAVGQIGETFAAQLVNGEASYA